MTTPRREIIRPEYEVEVHSIGAYLHALLCCMRFVLTFCPVRKISFMVGKRKLGEMVVWIIPRIRITYRRE